MVNGLFYRRDMWCWHRVAYLTTQLPSTFYPYIVNAKFCIVDDFLLQTNRLKVDLICKTIQWLEMLTLFNKFYIWTFIFIWHLPLNKTVEVAISPWLVTLRLIQGCSSSMSYSWLKVNNNLNLSMAMFKIEPQNHRSYWIDPIEWAFSAISLMPDWTPFLTLLASVI